MGDLVGILALSLRTSLQTHGSLKMSFAIFQAPSSSIVTLLESTSIVHYYCKNFHPFWSVFFTCESFTCKKFLPFWATFFTCEFESLTTIEVNNYKKVFEKCHTLNTPCICYCIATMRVHSTARCKAKAYLPQLCTQEF